MKTDYTALCANVDASDPEAVKGLLEEFTGREFEFSEDDYPPAVGNDPGDSTPVDRWKSGSLEVVCIDGGDFAIWFDEVAYRDLPALLRALEAAGLRNELSVSGGIEEYHNEACARCAELEAEVARLRATSPPSPPLGEAEYLAAVARVRELEAEVARLRERVNAARPYGRRRHQWRNQ